MGKNSIKTDMEGIRDEKIKKLVEKIKNLLGGGKIK